MHEKSLANNLRHPSDRASKSSFASTIQMLRLAIATGVSLAAWSIASPSFAIRLIGNTPEGTSFDATDMNGTQQKGLSFTLPSGTNYTLNSLTLRLRNYISATDTPLVQIRNNAGSPNPSGAALVNFTNPTSTDPAVRDFTFTPTASFTFQASTTYWLFVDNLNTGAATSFIWTREQTTANPTGVVPTSNIGATFNGYRFSTNNGNSYTNNTNYNTFNIDVTAQPIPFEFSPAWGLGLLGVWVAGSKLRNKLRQQVKL